MPISKVVIGLKQETLEHVGRLAHENVYFSRSRAIQEVVKERLSRLKKTRLTEECGKLDRADEQSMAEKTNWERRRNAWVAATGG